ncbi:MAG: hypothetical protein COA50_04005 [Flavobacteriaceae bacterium]|nr:MAG: hypothetical protein COA50_04005 [Flavobacteriaceae bacterium]
MKNLIIVLFIHCSLLTFGQTQKIPMDASHWKHDNAKAAFITHRGVSAIKAKDGAYYQIFLKDHVFANGTIEFDVELIGRGFPGINFRMSEDHKNGEIFYIRSFGKVTPLQRTTLQYAAVLDSVNLWDITDEYQAGATIHQEGWNHVKLVINGKQMRVYVNNMERPAMIVPKLESLREAGGISLSGNVIYGNFEIKPNVTEGLSAVEGYTSTYNEPRYLRNWHVSAPIDFPFGKDLGVAMPGVPGDKVKSDLPDSTTVWNPLQAESRAMVNLSRNFGLTKPGNRRLAWLKTTIHSETAQVRELALGFSDEVWVFINGKLLFLDKNYYGTPSQKGFRGRATIENASFKLPLKEGENEIMIGLANYFFGWGLVARLDQMDGITIK